MKIRDILQSKGSNVVTIAHDADVTAAVELLVHHNIGALVVIADGEANGIITERDILRALNEGAADFVELAVSDIMTTDVITGTPDAEVGEVMHVMSERRIRHLPVMQDGELQGMISIGDVVNAIRRDAETQNKQLQAYITGTPL
jgi:CBS domain-containing protein